MNEISFNLLATFYEFIFLMCEITVLFLLINSVMTYVNNSFNINKYLSNNLTSYFKAIFIGALTPFCSCSTIPLFNSLLKNGINHGISFAYLLTSPLINPMIFTMLLAAFGLKITIFYVTFIVIFVFIVSFVLSFLAADLLIKDDFLLIKQESKCKCKAKLKFKECFYKALLSYKKIFKYIFFGMLIGAFFHNFIPQDLLSNNLANLGIYGIFLASLFGILLYVRTDFVIPLGISLMNAGFPLGVLFSFLIAGGGCSLPELILLKSMFKTRMMIIFILSVLAMANIFGILLYFFY